MSLGSLGSLWSVLVSSGSLGSFGCALGVNGFSQGRWVDWGALLESLEVVGFTIGVVSLAEPRPLTGREGLVQCELFPSYSAHQSDFRKRLTSSNTPMRTYC